MKISRLLIVASFVLFSGCDMYHFNSCEWTLEPEKDYISKLSSEDIEQGYIPVCARNRVTNKQNCNLKAKLDYAKSVFQKKFKYEDLKIETNSKYPKPVIEVASFCE